MQPSNELPDPTPTVPFINRTVELARIRQHITDPVGHPPPAFLGWRGSGKTALLREAARTVSPGTIAVFVSLAQVPAGDALPYLVETATDALTLVGLAGASLPVPPAQFDLSWLIQDWKPAMTGVLRRRHRLLLLLDDLDRLLPEEAPDAPQPALAALRDLIGPQLGLTMTLDARHEDSLARFQPLLDPAYTSRLSGLSTEDCLAGLARTTGLDQAEPAVHQAIVRRAGGDPVLLQSLARSLVHVMDGPITLNQARPHLANAHRENDAYLRQSWAALSGDQQLTLTAIAALSYADPLAAIGPQDVVNWLIETEQPLDLTEVNAAVRALGYVEILEQRADASLAIHGELRRQWVLEHARISTPEARAQRRLRPAALLIIGATLLLLLALLAVALGSEAPSDGDQAAIPTVTITPR